VGQFILWAVVIGLLTVLAPVVVHGQEKPKNPREGTFTASVDHAQLDKYIVGFFAPGASSPVQTQDIGKPAPDGTNTCAFTFNSQPLTFGADYVARVKAVAGTAESAWSEVSNPFDRVPGPPGKPVIR
jgi:hypothetical protein